MTWFGSGLDSGQKTYLYFFLLTRIWFYDKKSPFLLYIFCTHLLRISLAYNDHYRSRKVPSGFIKHGISIAKTNGAFGMELFNYKQSYFFSNAASFFRYDSVSKKLVGFDLEVLLKKFNLAESESSTLNSERNPWAVPERITVNYSLPPVEKNEKESEEFTVSYVMISSKATSFNTIVIPEFSNTIDNG